MMASKKFAMKCFPRGGLETGLETGSANRGTWFDADARLAAGDRLMNGLGVEFSAEDG
jgi:hypothetical protein